MRLLCAVPHHRAQKRYARVSFFGSHPPSPLFLQHHSCRTGTLHPGGLTHRVSPSSDPSFCPCSGCLTCDCQFFQQLADRIRLYRPRISFLFARQPVEGIRYTVPDQYVLLGEYCTGTSTVPVFGTVRSCMNVLRGGISRVEQTQYLYWDTYATDPLLTLNPSFLSIHYPPVYYPAWSLAGPSPV